jgi:hypothetical protein
MAMTRSHGTASPTIACTTQAATCLRAKLAAKVVFELERIGLKVLPQSLRPGPLDKWRTFAVVASRKPDLSLASDPWIITVSTREADQRDRVSSTKLDPPHRRASPLVHSLIQC